MPYATQMKDQLDTIRRTLSARERRGREKAIEWRREWERVSYLDLLRNRPEKCPLCKRPMPEIEVLDVDHILAIKDGGSHTRENLRVVHMWCHRRHHMGLRHGPAIKRNRARKKEKWPEKQRPQVPGTILQLWKEVRAEQKAKRTVPSMP